MRIERIDTENRREANCFLEERWFTTDMAILGELVDMTKLPGFAAFDNGEMRGLITYRVSGDTMEIISLDSADEGHGLGTKLLDTALFYAEEHGLKKISVVITNDNLFAIRFYQKRGFDIVQVYGDTVVKDRVLKPELPQLGYFAIPIRTELKLERVL